MRASTFVVIKRGAILTLSRGQRRKAPQRNHGERRPQRSARSGARADRSGLPVTLDAGGRRAVTPIPVIGGGDAVRPNAAGPFNVNWLPAGSAGAANGLTNPDGVQNISAYAASLGLGEYDIKKIHLQEFEL